MTRRGTTRILSGSTFVVSDDRGDMDVGGGEVLGLFWRDMRHLSTWRLLMNGRPLDALSSDTLGYDEGAFFLVQPTGTVYRNPSVSVVRQRFVGEGFREDVTVTNSGTARVRIELTVLFDADFADIFEVKDRLPKQGKVSAEGGTNEVLFRYRRDDFARTTRISCPNGSFTGQSMSCRLSLDPGQTWSTEIEVVAGEGDPADGTDGRSGARRGGQQPRPQMSKSLDEWVGEAPRLDTDWDALTHTYARSLDDLAALRFYPPVLRGGESVPAAGLPWFMTLFGRDSILASYQSLPFTPELARATLHALAQRQAAERDDFRDAEPGKILHEIRFGELVHFGERPQSPYFGSADSTSLWLVLLDEYHRWSGDDDLVRELEQHARAALRWIDEEGDRDGDGYVEYERRNTTTGLENQCWKDWWNSIVHPDGSLASLPRATCELQGYAYDARLRAARLARQVWGDETFAAALEYRAARLRRRFNDDFWVADGDFFALALDGDKRQVRTLTSNMGQLLWSGIVDDDKVDAVVGHLMGSQLFSGWGVRTLAAGQPAYNPIEYHDGTVWPHDNSLIAAGLARYGRREEANRIAVALLDAAEHFEHRLPETFAGFDRSVAAFPVEYPTACSPQAWATGAPLLLLRVVLGLEPDGDRLRAAPQLPQRATRLALSGIPGRWGRATAGAG